jgi:hypothetical protein
MRVRIFYGKGFFPLLLSSLIILFLAGCAENSSILDNGQRQQLEFSVSTHSWDNSDKSSDQKIPSRATPNSIFDTSKSFNVIIDENKGGSWSTEVNNETVSYSSVNNIWQTTATHYWPGAGSTIDFYAYYPTSISSNITHTTDSAPVLSYTVPDNAADQIDILASSKTGVAGDSYNQTPVDFKHIFAAVQFSVGTSGLPSGTITKVTLNNILYKGTYSLDGTWTPNITDTKSFSQTVSVSTNASTTITSGPTTFMMIPQTLSNASITVTYSNGGKLTTAITGIWEAGKTYTYNLSKTIPVATFDYTGDVQSYTVPLTGIYKIECWGAQGGGNGGYGGYSYGNIKLSQNTILYICVGGYEAYKRFTGAHNPYNTYNGGGIGDSGGGGATHVSTMNRGELRNYASNQETVLIVAGGGGGVEWGGHGGNGGGLIGNDGDSQAISNFPASASAIGGSQTSGGTSVAQSESIYPGPNTLVNGSFGQGGYGYENSITDYGAGGGGGWYGGGGTSWSGAGGGGSGHLGSTLISGTTGMQNGVRSGNGYARITFVSAN